MPEDSNDLWPDDMLAGIEAVRTPVSILKEQAALIGKKTNNIVEGEVVDSISLDPGKPFAYTFNIVAPALNNYRLRVVRIAHGIELYPLNYQDDVMSKSSESSSEEAFIEALRRTLADKKLINVIRALIAQSKA